MSNTGVGKDLTVPSMTVKAVVRWTARGWYRVPTRESLTMEQIGLARRSACCLATIHAEDGMPDFLGDGDAQYVTSWFVCDKCAQPCDTLEVDDAA